VGVSFWEAEACCAWAGGRLPREQEWEAAARGPNGFHYPWGNDWQDGICNTREAGLGVTSPVGLFPRAGQAELGIEDLAGNVWEWCGSLYNPYEISNPNAPRVLRGGSWGNGRDVARSADRSGVSPDARNYSIGFRVVCSSPINEH
jgi:formylglycine-generating enzyme required for sulfatase activity